MLFSKSSEEGDSPDQGCFIAIIFEKQTRKRTYAKTATQFAKLKKQRTYRSEKTLNALNAKKASALQNKGSSNVYSDLAK
jgi:hypothetical protein